MSQNGALCDRIAALFCGELNVEVPCRNTDLIEARILSSLLIVDLLTCMEREFRTEIPLDQLEIDDFRSIAKIAELVARKTATTVVA